MKEAIEGRQGRGRPRSERARAAVLGAATDLLVSGQIDAVTMDAIAARSGVSKSTIYKWWPSRAHVILESFFNRARYTMAVDESASPREVLTSQVLSLIRLFRDSDAGPLMADLMAASQADPDIRAALEEQWLRPRRQVSAGLLRAGIERGELDSGTDIEAAVDQLYAPVDGAADDSRPARRARHLRGHHGAAGLLGAGDRRGERPAAGRVGRVRRRGGDRGEGA
jgi:AcrR family transcriptional regulator